jgi:glycosyltransferase involved in cell wall biosynthesis
MEKVDVVIPTFNETLKLFRAVESAMSQTYAVNKIFVIDDGSDSRVTDEIRGKLGWSPNLFLIFSDHTGHPGLLRRLAISHSDADWIAFLDADDYWDPDKTRLQLGYCNESLSQFICSKARVVSSELEKECFSDRHPLPEKIGLSDIFLDNKIISSSVLVKTELLRKVGLYASGAGVRGVEDYATWLRILSRERGAYMDQALVYYSHSNHSLSRSSGIAKPFDALVDFAKWLFVQRPRRWEDLLWGVLALTISGFWKIRHQTANLLAARARLKQKNGE